MHLLRRLLQGLSHSATCQPLAKGICEIWCTFSFTEAFSPQGGLWRGIMVQFLHWNGRKLGWDDNCPLKVQSSALYWYPIKWSDIFRYYNIYTSWLKCRKLTRSWHVLACLLYYLLTWTPTTFDPVRLAVRDGGLLQSYGASSLPCNRNSVFQKDHATFPHSSQNTRVKAGHLVLLSAYLSFYISTFLCLELSKRSKREK